jgi:hypothetical protein
VEKPVALSAKAGWAAQAATEEAAAWPAAAVASVEAARAGT